LSGIRSEDNDASICTPLIRELEFIEIFDGLPDAPFSQVGAVREVQQPPKAEFNQKISFCFQ